MSPRDTVSVTPVDGMARGGAPGILRDHVLDVPRGHHVPRADLHDDSRPVPARRPRREQSVRPARLHRRGTSGIRSPQPRYARRALVIPQEDFFMTDRPLTLMAVHAHPDDEATGTGGVLARYAAEGIRTVLVTCTDGGCGDGPGVSSQVIPGTIRRR